MLPFTPGVQHVLCCTSGCTGVPCLGDSLDKSHGIYLRVAFMTASVVYPEAIIRGWLLAIKPWLLTGKIRYVAMPSALGL